MKTRNSTQTTTLHAFEGSLWKGDTVVRKTFAQHFRLITNTQELKATLRAGSFTDLGGYPLYFITSDGCALSFEAVLDNLTSVLDSVKHQSNDGWNVVGCDINYEDPELYCEHTGKRIESAYAEDQATR